MEYTFSKLFDLLFKLFKIIFDYSKFFRINIKLAVPAIFIVTGKSRKNHRNNWSDEVAAGNQNWFCPVCIE